MNSAEKLKIVKSLSGLTQEKLAKKLSVSFATLNSWINNKSVPRRRASEKLDNLYFQFTGQREIPHDPLKAKKQIIFNKTRYYKNIVKKIINSPDIYDQFLLSLTYNTNRIEGSTLTEDETKTILFDNVTLSNKSVIEHLEVKNHQAAWEYLLKQFSKESFKIDEKLVLKLHSILMNGIRNDAGTYRRHGVRIAGTYVPTANYLKVPQLMKQLIKNINSNRSDVVKHTSNIHSRFEKIHPFSDGNGRIGRLLIQAMLLPKNIAPAIIKKKHKRLYNSSLRKSQIGDDFLPLEDFICQAIFEGFKVLERIF